MIKDPNQTTREALQELRHNDKFREVLYYIRLLALTNHSALPSCTGEDTIRRQGETQALSQLYKNLSGKDVFDGPA